MPQHKWRLIRSPIPKNLSSKLPRFSNGIGSLLFTCNLRLSSRVDWLENLSNSWEASC